jgi:hypothetical protein
MPEDELLKEFAEILSNVQKGYVKSYIRDKGDGLSTKFDEFVEANMNET